MACTNINLPPAATVYSLRVGCLGYELPRVLRLLQSVNTDGRRRHIRLQKAALQPGEWGWNKKPKRWTYLPSVKGSSHNETILDLIFTTGLGRSRGGYSLKTREQWSPLASFRRSFLPAYRTFWPA